MADRGRDYKAGERIPGTVYAVVRLIGAGGMGTVYDVEDTTIGKRYVLKTLHPHLGARHDLARRMQNEARQLARLNHSNIVEVITAGVTGDDLRLPYYVMERLNGQSLRVVLEKKGQLEIGHAYHIGVDLLDALDHAHDKGVVHRDVKPDNIFLHRTSAGVTVTKLLDFGVLSLLDSTARETAGRFVGTLRYAAPEQLRGETPSPQVDVYAAGLVLYEMITGRGPFDDEGDAQSIGSAHVHKAPPPVSEFVSVPLALEELIMSALAKSPEARPRDAFSFGAALRELKSTVGRQARDSTGEQPTSPAVIGPDSVMAAYVHVRQPLSEGPYVISPARESAEGRPTSLPKTTIPGAALPTAAGSAGGLLVDAITATSAGAVDRTAATGTFLPDTSSGSRNGTEPFELVPPHPSQLPMSPPAIAADAHFQWPSERASTPSEQPQIRTLSGAPRRPSHFTAALIAAGAALSGAIVALSLVAARQPSSSSGGRVYARNSGSSAEAPRVAESASGTRVVAPVAAAASVTEEAPSRVSTGAPAVSVGSPPRAKLHPASSASSGRSGPPPVRTDRPGPGF